MSFFKKLLGTNYISEEEKERALLLKEEKRKEKEEKRRLALEQKAEKEAYEKQLIEKYFGLSSITNRMNFSLYKKAIFYFEEFVKSPYEDVLIAIPAEYDKTKNREIKGLLIATSENLIFVTSGIGQGEYTEQLDYRKINGISLAPDGLGQKELLIDYGRSRKIFDDIVNDDQFKQFLNTVRTKMHESKQVTTKSKPRTRSASASDTPSSSDDKYNQLEQIGKLREQGILTEEEFQLEKQKILNS
nr:SHOCT domain-containing protein [Lysinibacillus timonensis]